MWRVGVRSKDMVRPVTTVIQRDGRAEYVSVQCDGCHRSAASIPLNAEELRDLIGWEHAAGTDLCTMCQQERGSTSPITRRFDNRFGRAR